ncbi:MAG: hypothetical protein A2Y62_04365 [Candidatus Fischerbacteria bacterium RBG_13_37_8]|uniref:Uncharacterized protein n=1 Tax=Candidatus Fischerbacteria bacterium RBG_13_37_8 TaxID=1817863 RepID=A0A1F5VXJ4_9BACT|nr:MAG: hypothetical protein A2Y62_04365 [Candidatus Fischerbacteria bacterium RBG_13_37_8]
MKLFIKIITIVLLSMVAWSVSLMLSVNCASNIFYKYFIPNYFRGPLCNADYLLEGGCITDVIKEFAPLYFIYGCIIGFYFGVFNTLLIFLFFSNIIKRKAGFLIINILFMSLIWGFANCIGHFLQKDLSDKFLDDTLFKARILLSIIGCFIGILIHCMQAWLMKLSFKQFIIWFTSGIFGISFGILAVDVGLFQFHPFIHIWRLENGNEILSGGTIGLIYGIFLSISYIAIKNLYKEK